MKKNIKKIFITSCLLILGMTAFSGCASTKENDPNFIADLEPIYLGETICLSQQLFMKPKAITIDVNFDPENSTYFAQFKIMGEKVELKFSPKEKANFASGIESYLQLNADGKLDKNHEPKMSNKFQSGNLKIRWGTFGYGRQATAPYDTNYEILDDKPYFRLRVQSVASPDDEDIKSPYINFYFSPKQLEDLKNLTNMDSIMVKIDEIENAAYSFE